MTSYDKTLKTFLAHTARLGSLPEGFAYRNLYDFLDQHGTFFEPRVKPRKIEQGVPRCCYGNSIMMAIKCDWTYVEGVAMNHLGVPIHHAWNLLPDGSIMDITWERPGLAYCGVPFSTGRADDATWNGDACVLDDFHRGHPLFKERWQGEDFERVWKPSCPMRHALEIAATSSQVVSPEEMRERLKMEGFA